MTIVSDNGRKKQHTNTYNSVRNVNKRNTSNSLIVVAILPTITQPNDGSKKKTNDGER